LRNMPTELIVEGGESRTAHSWSRVETVSYDEAFKRELLELHSAISDDRAPLTDGLDGLHDVTLCRSVARAHLNQRPVEHPSSDEVHSAS
jgi:predicted dehydrogenase